MVNIDTFFKYEEKISKLSLFGLKPPEFKGKYIYIRTKISTTMCETEYQKFGFENKTLFQLKYGDQ
jgi:hypothetical protein